MKAEYPADNPIQVVLKFEELINSGLPEAISAFMTPDGEFIDSLGNRIQGAEKLRSAWIGYFKMVPDYSISHSEIFAAGNTVAVFGSAQGTYVPAVRSGQGEAGVPGTRDVRVQGLEAGVPGTRDVRVQGLEAGSRAEPAASGAEAGVRADPSQAGRREAAKNKDNYWKTPASWRAVVKEGKIAIWQVFADNEPIRAIMRKHS